MWMSRELYITQKLARQPLGVATTIERRSMPPHYIRPESLSLLDLSLVLLSSPPLRFSEPYPSALLISHHSGPRAPGAFLSFFSVFPSSLSLPDERATQFTCPPVASHYSEDHLPTHLPRDIFLGRGSRCKSPQRKVGVVASSMRRRTI